ncbi:MAG: hypothetical protein ACHQLA_06550 [Ignavibacteriales bacterium]
MKNWLIPIHLVIGNQYLKRSYKKQAIKDRWKISVFGGEVLSLNEKMKCYKNIFLPINSLLI